MSAQIYQSSPLQRIVQIVVTVGLVLLGLVIATGILQVILILLAIGFLGFLILKLPFVQKYIKKKFAQNYENMQQQAAAAGYKPQANEKDITAESKLIEEKPSPTESPESE